MKRMIYSSARFFGAHEDEEDDLFVFSESIEGSNQRHREGVYIESSFPGGSLRGLCERDSACARELISSERRTRFSCV